MVVLLSKQLRYQVWRFKGTAQIRIFRKGTIIYFVEVMFLSTFEAPKG